jgi:hypothetical protein
LCDPVQLQENMAEQVAARIQEGLRMAAIPHVASTVSDHVTASMGIAGMTAGLTGTRSSPAPMRRCIRRKMPGGIAGLCKNAG